MLHVLLIGLSLGCLPSGFSVSVVSQPSYLFCVTLCMQDSLLCLSAAILLGCMHAWGAEVIGFVIIWKLSCKIFACYINIGVATFT